MKILMLNYEFPPLGGGAANANYYLLKEFSRRSDLSVDLVTSSAKNRFETEKFSESIRIYRLDVKKKDIHYWKMSEIARWTWKAYCLSKKLLKKNRYNVCHCWFGWPSGIIGNRFRKNLPYIVALRGSDVPGYNLRLKILDRFVFTPLSKKVWKHAKAVIANSEGLKELALKTLNTKIDVIYNGVDVDEFKPDYKTHKELRLLCVSRLIERKGIRYLIEAASHLKNVNLTIIGEGDQERKLKALAKGLNIQDRVKFLGYVPHNKIKENYKNSDVFVLPSLNEGMSNTVLEAMASGLPIIVTDVGGTKELVDCNGYVVKKKSVRKLVDAIQEFINNKNRIISLGKQSRKIAEGLGWNIFAREYLKLYGMITNNLQPPRI